MKIKASGHQSIGPLATRIAKPTAGGTSSIESAFQWMPLPYRGGS